MSNGVSESAVNVNGPLINKSQYPIVMIILLMLAFGVYGFVQTLLYGHHAWGTSDQIPWGLLLATYVFFVVSSTGLCLCCSLGSVFQLDRYRALGIRAVLLSLVGLIVGFIVIAIELAHPFRLLIYAVISPNFTSTIWLMGALYGLYMVFLILELWFMIRQNHQVGKIFATLAFLSAIVAHSNLGGVFGLIAARSYWAGPYLPIYFILSAFVSGSAILALFFYLIHRKGKENHESLIIALGKLLALFLAISIFFTTWKMIAGIHGHVPGKYEATMALVKGPLSLNFWLFEVLIGSISPFLVLLMAGRNIRAVFTAALLAIVGIFVMRYDLVVGGQIVPLSIDKAHFGGYLSYMPTVAEWGIVIGALALVPILFVLGLSFLSFLGTRFGRGKSKVILKEYSESV